MGCGNIDIVSSYTGEINTGFNDVFQSLGDYMIFTGKKSGLPIFLQILVAVLGKHHSCSGNSCIFQTGRLGTKRSSTFEIGSQRISHTGNQEANRCVGDYGAVYQNTVRIGGIEEVLLEGAVIVVNHGKTGTGRIGGYNGRDNDDMLLLVKGCCLRRIHGGTATYTNYGINSLFLYDFPHSGNFRFTGNASKDFIMTNFIRSFEAFF